MKCGTCRCWPLTLWGGDTGTCVTRSQMAAGRAADGHILARSKFSLEIGRRLLTWKQLGYPKNGGKTGSALWVEQGEGLQGPCLPQPRLSSVTRRHISRPTVLQERVGMYIQHIQNALRSLIYTPVLNCPSKEPFSFCSHCFPQWEPKESH